MVRRITGFQTPIFGLNWEAPEPDREVAKRVLIFLEDQRLLTSSYDVLLQNLHYVKDAIFRIRNKLTEEMEHLDRSSPLAQSMAAMRAACRKCLDQLERYHCPLCFHDIRELGAEIILIAIGELRSTFGIHIAQISVRYGIDIEKDLEPILPNESEAHIKHEKQHNGV